MNKAYMIFGVLVILAIGIILTNDPHHASQSNQELTMIQKTLEREKIVAQKLIANHFEQRQFIQKDNANPQERGLASEGNPVIIETVKKSLEGEVARDPWGHPFKYKVIGDGNPSTGSKVIILSSGPNGKIDTDMGAINSDSTKSDDIAVVVNI